MRVLDQNGRRAGVRTLSCLALGAFLFAGALLLVRPAQALLPHAGHGGRNAQGYLGINVRDVSDEQMVALKITGARGAEIVLVDHDGPACHAGLREHDVIVAMNGQPVENEKELRRMLRETPAGKTVSFLINRDGQQQTLSTQLANRETVGQEAWGRHMTVPDPASGSSWHGNGFLGSDAPSVDAPGHGFLGTAILNSSYTGALLEMMGPQLAQYFGASGGLLVRSVDPDSPAAVAGMRAGDVVLRLNDQPIANGETWLKTVHESRGKPLSVVVLRDRREQTLTLTPDAKRRSSILPHLWPEGKSKAS